MPEFGNDAQKIAEWRPWGGLKAGKAENKKQGRGSRTQREEGNKQMYKESQSCY